MQAQIPGLPSRQTGWLEGDALGPGGVSRARLVIDRERLTLSYVRADRELLRARIGVGSETPTPRGRFTCATSSPYASPRYGPLAYGLSARSRLTDWPGGGFIGIHGTDRPDLLPGRGLARVHPDGERRHRAARAAPAVGRAGPDHVTGDTGATARVLRPGGTPPALARGLRHPAAPRLRLAAPGTTSEGAWYAGRDILPGRSWRRPPLRPEAHQFGNGPTRRLRRQGLIPGVVYEPGKPSLAFSLPERELRRVLAEAAAR